MRILKVTIENFKGVNYGEISFENERRPVGPSILALYGQNGSGKSALVESILALRLLIERYPIPSRFANYIHKDADFASFEYIFSAEGDEDFSGHCSHFLYRVEFVSNDNHVSIVNESLHVIDVDKQEQREFFSTIGYEPFGPKSYIEGMSKKKIERINENHEKGESYVFSFQYFGYEELLRIQEMAPVYLQIIGSKDMEEIESGKLIIPCDDSSFRGSDAGYEIYDDVDNLYFDHTLGLEWIDLDRAGDSFDFIRISTDPSSPTFISLSSAGFISNTLLGQINKIINKIVPGMELGLNAKQEINNNKLGVQCHLISIRDERVIPLCCESRGVQKLVALTLMLINVYNNKEYIAVVDEIDSGIFEYLLGEIMRVIAEGGEGQLICTSHNLRPLEVLDSGYIAFTTNNPDNRYMRPEPQNTDTNLRDYYYRNILLDNHADSIYSPSTFGELSMCFILANERCLIDDSHSSQQYSLFDHLESDDIDDD